MKRFISVPVRVSGTHRTLVIAAKADREVQDKRACQGSRHARNAYNGVKDEPRHALISVPARVSGIAKHSANQRKPAEISGNQLVLKSSRTPKLFILQGI